MKYVTYSHCAGDKALCAMLQKEMAAAITAIMVRPTRGAAKKFRVAFLDSLKSSGWSSEVPVAEGSDMTITSMKASDCALGALTGAKNLFRVADVCHSDGGFDSATGARHRYKPNISRPSPRLVEIFFRAARTPGWPASRRTWAGLAGKS